MFAVSAMMGSLSMPGIDLMFLIAVTRHDGHVDVHEDHIVAASRFSISTA
jgi:hypothetical protein